jgi:uncharacterized damage-inducible protein DinB
MENKVLENTTTKSVFTTTELLEHWQGHRKLTRRVIEAFPEDKLFNFSVGGMRPFSELSLEIIGMCLPGMDGIVSSNWGHFDDVQKNPPRTKADLLSLWDEVTEKINRLWPAIKPERFHEEEAAFGIYDGTILSTIFYFIDNEIHHRGQGYVYLRALNIEPPHFWER